MRINRVSSVLIVLAIAAVLPIISSHLMPTAHAKKPYTLTPFPVFTQEGNTVALVLTVNNANVSTTYQFMFFVRDPANKTSNSAIQTHTTGPNENQFSILVN